MQILSLRQWCIAVSCVCVTDMGGGSSAELLISEAVVCCFESVTDVGGSSCAALVSESCLGQ